MFPFVFLLLSVAIIPLISEHFWEKNFAKVILFFTGITLFSDIFILHDVKTPILSIIEYLQFIIFIVVLYIISGGIYLEFNKKGTPIINTCLLLFGALISNIIGTTGAATLLIRPFMKINRGRLEPYHIVFFIFIVCNIGGSLSPIGDPPLFSGFLKGVPFFWTLKHNILPWILANSLLSLIFFLLDKKNKKICIDNIDTSSILKIEGKINFVYILLTLCVIFINPIIIPSIPTINIFGHHIAFIREILLVIIGICAYKTSDKNALEKNEFTLAPIHELCILFLGIFITMAPALHIIEDKIQHIDHSIITPTLLYWIAAFFSSFLDNTPTYINALAVCMSINGADISNVKDVYDFSCGLYPNSIEYLRTICLTSVFFGGFTYIGNGPNFMIKAIAEKNGVKMPTFFSYILKYSFVYLLPVLTLIWFLFSR